MLLFGPSCTKIAQMWNRILCKVCRISAPICRISAPKVVVVPAGIDANDLVQGAPMNYRGG